MFRSPKWNSKLSALGANDMPASTRSSNPSTSILMNEGAPYFLDRESSVATLTSIAPSHSSPLWIGDVLAVSYHSFESVLSVGSAQTFIVAVPSSSPTAQFSIIRSLRLAINSSLSQQAGFG